MNNPELVLDVAADTSNLERSLVDVSRLSRQFASSMTSAFDQVVIKGKDLDDVLRSLVLRLSNSAFEAAMIPVEQGLSSLFSNAFGGLASAFGSGTTAPLSITPFATGGVISEPSYFQSRRGLGVMGEAGPEAIMPLTRGPDGRLGVRSSGGGAANVQVSISTPDVAGFRRSRGRIATDLARAVDQGRRYL